MSADKNLSCVIKNPQIFVAQQKSADKKSFQMWLKTKRFIDGNTDLWLVRDIVYKMETEWKEEAILKFIELYENHLSLCYC